MGLGIFWQKRASKRLQLSPPAMDWAQAALDKAAIKPKNVRSFS
jgi:hypothetical protein